MLIKKTSSCFSGPIGPVLICAALMLGAGPLASAAVLVVEQIGDGASHLTNWATPVFLKFLTTDGLETATSSLPHVLPRPQSSPYNLMDSGSSDSDGLLTRSVNGLYVQMPGYNGTNGEVSIANSSASVVRRTIGLINTAGGVDTSRAFSMLSSNNYRSVVSVDGSAFWAAGHPGIVFVTGNTVTQVTDLNTRNINIFNGQLFCTMGGTIPGVYIVGSGLPTTSSTQFIYLPVGGSSGSPFGFQFDSAMKTCYVADEGTNKGIVKFTYNSSSWVSNYTLSTGNGARGLAVDWSHPGVPVVYATTAENSSNRLVRIVDQGASSPAVMIGNAGKHAVFRGVDFLGLPAVWKSPTSGYWSVGSTTPWVNWSVCLANGNMIQFQNVNTGANPLSLSVTNNSGLSWARSISFSGGYGTSAGSSYTVRGNNISLTGGVSSDSPLTQTIKMGLALSAAQTFTTGPGNLVLDGVLSGGNGFTKAGSGALFLNAVNTSTGPVAVNQGELVVTGVLTNSLLNVNSGLLSGSGTINGPVVVQTQSELNPGRSNTIGTLTIRGQLDLFGRTTMEISKSGTNRFCDAISGVTRLNCGGTLIVQLLAGTLAAGDSFTLFRAGQISGGFQSIILPHLPDGLFWDSTALTTAGTIRVGAIVPPTLTTPVRLPDGTLQLKFSGPPGLSYRVLVSDNLAYVPFNWFDVGSGVFAADGQASFIDAPPPPGFNRFYVISVP